MVIITWTWKRVFRAVKAMGHWFWAGFQIQGYIMAMEYLPADETQKMVEEFQLSNDPLAGELKAISAVTEAFRGFQGR